MNLFDLSRRKDTNLETSGDVAMARRRYPDGEWRGLMLQPGASFRIPDVRRFVSFRHFPSQCGWLADVADGDGAVVSLRSGEDGTVLGERSFGSGLQPVTLPWPLRACKVIDIVVSNPASSKSAVFIANHRPIDRNWLYDLCRGRGVEIGPGPVPQILPDDTREVFYLEQMPAEEWNKLYNGGGKYPVKPELWSKYIVGVASELPVDDASLDFIFGSHVFEHLANPIGHLERWRAKLAPGGRIAMVVPDLHGTKDSIQHRCSLESMIDEHQRDIWMPETAHYVRHLRRTADDRRLIAYMERNESIHVHYYDNINCQILLDHACTQLGYSDYVINHTPNHKDFHFVLFN